jgi:hypothetical protein
MGMVEALDPLDEIRILSEHNGWGGTFEYAIAFDHPKLDSMLVRWLAKARDGIPRRSDLDARTLQDILPNLWMVDAVPSGATTRYRCRRMGTEVAAALGEMTGKYLDETIPAPLLPRWTLACEAFLRCRKPVRFTCNVDLPQANFLQAEALHAPLLDAAGKPTILMSVMFFRPAGPG